MSSYFHQLDEAKTVAEVVAIARDYLASWTPGEIAQLPVDCRPTRIRDESDVTALHACLADEYRATRASGDALTRLQLLTSFMVRTVVRMAEIDGTLSPPLSGESREPAGSRRP
jgi:hypothetical protein